MIKNFFCVKFSQWILCIVNKKDRPKGTVLRVLKNPQTVKIRKAL